MSPVTVLAPCQKKASGTARPQTTTLGALLDQIRVADLDSLYAAFEVPTIFAATPWAADSFAVVDEHDGDAEAQGFDYVLEVALARERLDAIAFNPGFPDPTPADSVEAVIAYSAMDHDMSVTRTPWVSRCLAF